jgi:hypothetical protein
MKHAGHALSGAVFSDDMRYRYQLWRRWDDSLPLVLWLMLNPSVADHLDLDPTVTRCTERSKRLGYGGLLVANLFGLISTDPKGLLEVIDPVGPDNDRQIALAAQRCSTVIAGWGKSEWQLVGDRAHQVVSMLANAGHGQLYALKTTKDGDPHHPLYLPYKLQPTPWRARS